METEKTLSFAVEEMYNMAEKNYDWESFKYVVPKKYHHSNQSAVNIKQTPSHKKNYIDDVLYIKKQIPGPCHYKPLPQNRPVSGKMDKNPRKTIAQTIIDHAKTQKWPGPCSYFTRPKTADNKKKTYVPQYREHYLNQVQYHANQYPGVGQYNLHQKVQSHITSPKFIRSQSEKMFKSVKKDSENTKKDKENTNQTLIAGTFDWIALQKKKATSNFFGKCKRFVTGSKFDKKPAPNQYKINTKWSDPTNMLKASTSTTTFKSVYYS